VSPSSVTTAPPPSSGGVALAQMLQERLHLTAERLRKHGAGAFRIALA